MAMNLSQQPPLARSGNLNILDNLNLLETSAISIANAFTLAAGQVASSLSKNTYAIDPNYKIGYAQTWNLSIQQNLPLSMQTTVTYMGVKGTNLDRTFQPWTLPPGSTASPYPSGYTYETYGGNSSLNQVTVQGLRRFSGGVSVNTQYTFSKYLSESGREMDWLDFHLNRAPMTGPNRLTISAQYSTGQGMRGAGLLTGWKGHLVKDWTVQTSITLASGNPLTPSCASNVCTAVGSTGLSSRPEYTGAPIGAVAPGYFFNTSAFINPIPGQWGDAAPGSIPGPTIYSLNGSASRVIRFGERHSADLQIQTTNALNTVIINAWDMRVGSQTFGEATGTSGMRNVTASLRFRF
jgi:hypothetical protein